MVCQATNIEGFPHYYQYYHQQQIITFFTNFDSLYTFIHISIHSILSIPSFQVFISFHPIITLLFKQVRINQTINQSKWSQKFSSPRLLSYPACNKDYAQLSILLVIQLAQSEVLDAEPKVNIGFLLRLAAHTIDQ